MSEEWKNLSEEQRVPYHKMAEQDKVRYEKDKKEYEKTKGAAAASVTKSATKSGKKSVKKGEDDINKILWSFKHAFGINILRFLKFKF